MIDTVNQEGDPEHVAILHSKHYLLTCAGRGPLLFMLAVPRLSEDLLGECCLLYA